jgi:hypothetical protein
MQQQPDPSSGAVVAPATVRSTAVVPADPMTPSPAGARPPRPVAAVDAIVMYSHLVQESLTNALLDNSRVLAFLKNGDYLQIEAIPVDVLVTNPLQANPSRQLLLRIKQDDLAAFHDGKITRDQAKARVDVIFF